MLSWIFILFKFHLACWVSEDQQRLSGAFSAWPPPRSPHTRTAWAACSKLLFFSRKWSLIKSCIVWASVGALHSLGQVQMTKGKPVVCYGASRGGSVHLSRAAGNGTDLLGFVPLPAIAARAGRAARRALGLLPWGQRHPTVKHTLFSMSILNSELLFSAFLPFSFWLLLFLSGFLLSSLNCPESGFSRRLTHHRF